MTLTMQRVQARYGKPARDVILDLYRKHSQSRAVAGGVAAELGITAATLWNWRARLSISDEDVRRTILEGEVKQGIEEKSPCVGTELAHEG